MLKSGAPRGVAPHKKTLAALGRTRRGPEVERNDEVKTAYSKTTPAKGRSSHRSRYFIATKRGLRPYNLRPGDEVPFAVQVRGKWCLVYRAAPDAEYLTGHPEAAWRFTARRHSRDYFEFRIVTRDGSTIADGDVWDVYGKLDHSSGGTRRDRLRMAVERLLADPNRAYPAAWAA